MNYFGISPINHSEIGLMFTNLAIANWGTTLKDVLMLVLSMIYPVVNGGSCLERLGYPYSSRLPFKWGANKKLRNPFPNHMIANFWLYILNFGRI